MTQKSITISTSEGSVPSRPGDYIYIVGEFRTYKVVESFRHSIRAERMSLLTTLSVGFKGLFR